MTDWKALGCARIPQAAQGESRRARNNKYWKNKADKVWGEVIHLLHPVCAIEASGVSEHDFGPCNGPVEAHHVVTRGSGTLRHRVENGIGLCSSHHKWGRICSAHLAPDSFFIWMQEYRPEQWQWMKDNRMSIDKYDYRQAFLSLVDFRRGLEEFEAVWESGGVVLL